MKLCIIMRGIPGSNRHELAEMLISSLKLAEIKVEDVFKDAGVEYDYKKLPEMYKVCWTKFRDLIDQDVDVVLNNSNPKLYNYSHYADYARRNGYEVVVVSVDHPDPKLAAVKSNIPEKAIRKMLGEWEQ